MIEVYYERISHELLVESQAFGVSVGVSRPKQPSIDTFQWASLMADFGGQLGLWMGKTLAITDPQSAIASLFQEPAS